VTVASKRLSDPTCEKLASPVEIALCGRSHTIEIGDRQRLVA
jgi:hypothetical protein